MRALAQLITFASCFGEAAIAQSTDASVKLNLYSIEAVECGAGRSVPAECISRGAQMCLEAQSELLEMAIQFKPNSRDVATLWFRCAVRN